MMFTLAIIFVIAIVDCCFAMKTLFRETLVNTQVYSTRDQGCHLDSEHRVLKELSHYELHDLSSFFDNRDKRRRLGTNGETFRLRALGKDIDITFSKFEQLFSDNYKHSYVDENGQEIRSEPALDCIHSAEAGALKGSIALCKDRELLATFFGDNQEFSIEPVTTRRTLGGKLEKLHVIYAHKDFTSDIQMKMKPMRVTDEQVKKERKTPIIPKLRPISSSSSLTEVDSFMSLTTYVDSKTKYVGVVQVNDNAFYRL